MRQVRRVGQVGLVRVRAKASEGLELGMWGRLRLVGLVGLVGRGENCELWDE